MLSGFFKPYVHSALLLGTLFGSLCLSANGAELKECTPTEQGFESRLLPLKNGAPKMVRYRAILPKGFDAKKNYGVVYFLHGRGGDRFSIEQLGACTELDRLARDDRARFIIVAPDGELSYWMNGAKTGERWGEVVTRELVTDVESKFNVWRAPEGRLLAGISMGGHGAIQLNLNFPGIFGALAAHSPVFRTQEEALSDFPEQFGMGTAYQERDPFSLIYFFGKRLDIPIWLDIGGEDPWRRNTVNFASTLRSVGYTGELHVDWDPIGGHVGAYWMHHLPTYFNWYAEQLRTH